MNDFLKPFPPPGILVLSGTEHHDEHIIFKISITSLVCPHYWSFNTHFFITNELIVAENGGKQSYFAFVVTATGNCNSIPTYPSKTLKKKKKKNNNKKTNN